MTPVPEQVQWRADLVAEVAGIPRDSQADEIAATLHKAAVALVDLGEVSDADLVFAVLAAVANRWPEDRRPAAADIAKSTAWSVGVAAPAREAENATLATVDLTGDEPPTTTTTKPTADDDREIERSDIANATRFVDMHGGVVRHCADIDLSQGGRWYIWTGTHWRHDTDGHVMRLAEITVKQIGREYLAEAEDLFQQSRDCDDTDAGKAKAKAIRGQAYKMQSKAEQVQSCKKMLDMLRLAKSRAGIATCMAAFDVQDYLFNCASGVIDLRDGRVYKHQQKFLLSKISPVAYDPKADRAKLMQVVTHVTNYDQAVAEFVQLVLGNSILGNNRLEKFYLWIGPGRSGKGTLLEAVKAAMGDYAMTAESKSFVQVQGARVRDDLDRLKYGRLVLSSEINKGEALDAAIIKTWSGGDTLATRQLYGSYQEFRSRATLHLQANDRPRIDDQDGAMWERLRVIPCGPTVPEDKRDPALKEWLHDPARGGAAVLAWLVEGAIKTHAVKNIPSPEAVKKACAEYRTDQDPTKDFMEEGLLFASAEHREQTFCLVRDVISAYHKFCHDRHVAEKFRVSEQNLAKRLEAKGAFRKKRRIGPKPESVWHGFTLPDREHVCARQTFMPDSDEHAAALGLFLCSQVPALLQTPTRAHAHAPTHVDTLLIHRNTGTQEQNGNGQETTLDLFGDGDGGPLP